MTSCACSADFGSRTIPSARQFPFQGILPTFRRFGGEGDPPVFPGAEPIHWGFDDPAEASAERRTETFRRVRDEIMQRLRLFILSNRD
jgi:hypothetical protein